MHHVLALIVYDIVTFSGKEDDGAVFEHRAADRIQQKIMLCLSAVGVRSIGGFF